MNFGIEYADVAVVTLGYPAHEARHPGQRVPGTSWEGRTVKGVTY